MSQMTRTVKTVEVSPNVFNIAREEQFYDAIQDVCAKLVSNTKVLLKWGSNIDAVDYLEEEKGYKTAKFDAMTILACVRHKLFSLDDIDDENAKKVWAFFQKRQEYLVLDDSNIILDVKKIINTVQSGKEIEWLPKEANEILVSKVLKGNEEFINKIKDNLLHSDEYAVALDPYDEKILTAPNRGHWDLWDKVVEENSEELLIDIGEGLTARNPAADVSDGIVAIDFGTKNTVVVYETDDLQVLPLQVGSGTYSKGLQVKNYENPTVLQFIDLDSFLAAYAEKSGHPDTSWNDVTVSHNAFENLKNATSDQHCTFFDGLKQWFGNQRSATQTPIFQG